MGAAAEQIARLRSQTYTMLSLLFRQPERSLFDWFGNSASERFARKLMKKLPSSLPGEKAIRLIQTGRAMVAAGQTAELVAEYNYLFSATPSVRVPLWASAYLGGEQPVCGEPARLASQIYARAGFALWAKFPDHVDHLVPELHFLAVLSQMEADAWKSKSVESAAHWADLEDEFLFQHLSPWIESGLKPRMQEWAKTGFYALAASALVELQSMDRSWIRTIRQRLKAVQALPEGGI